MLRGTQATRSHQTTIRLVLITAFAWVGSVSAISIRHDVPASNYFNLAAQYPTVGRIDDSIGALCTGTLVAPDKVITAAHCVDGINGPIDNNPDLPIAGTTFSLGNDLRNPSSVHPISSIAVNSWSNQDTLDMAVITLAAPVPGVTPSVISDQNVDGQVGTMVGFGAHGNGLNFNFGSDDLKRAANNTLNYSSTIESDFDHPNGSTSTFGNSQPLPLEGTTASGDSGGPIFVDFGSGPVLTGVLSGGFNNFGGESEYGDISIWPAVNNSTNKSFLLSQGLTIGTPSVSADFDGDGDYDCADIDSLTSQVAANSNSAQFDLTGDGTVDGDDVSQWLADAGAANLGPGKSYLPGDATLDGVVDGSDFNVWNNSKFTMTAAWCSGDFNSDGAVDGSDFNVWNAGKFTVSDVAASLAFAHRPAAVPEPGSCTLLLMAIAGIVRRKLS